MSASYWFEGSDYCDHNITYNMGPMLRAAGFPGWQEFRGMRARQVARLMEQIISELVMFPEEYTKFEPANGWGSLPGAVQWARALQLCALTVPKRSTLEGSL